MSDANFLHLSGRVGSGAIFPVLDNIEEKIRNAMSDVGISFRAPGIDMVQVVIRWNKDGIRFYHLTWSLSVEEIAFARYDIAERILDHLEKARGVARAQ